MKNRNYKDQVRLLLSVLPDVAKEQCFALHGGTAINLFIRNMPRLSVDIDLTYCPIEDRSTTLQNIDEALVRIQRYVKATLTGARVRHQNETRKLLISHDGAEVKLEVNTVSRGLLSDPIKRPLCEKTQAEFDAFVVTPIVPLGQLYGGKICAALDRQHPRDLFDIKYLLENEGITDEIRKGFLFCLLCSDRPINEVISPNFQDQRQAMDNQFKGMSLESFSYEDFERTRETLVETVKKSLTNDDKTFLLSVKETTPKWDIYDFEHFPAIKWKLLNLKKLKTDNPAKHKKQLVALRDKLNY